MGDKPPAPANVHLKHWERAPIISRRNRHAPAIWDRFQFNHFAPSRTAEHEEGTVVQAPWARSRSKVITRRATRLGAVGSRRVDPLYLPAHTTCALAASEVADLREAGARLAHGIVRAGDVRPLLRCCYANEFVAAAKARHCRRDLKVSKRSHATFAGVAAWVARARTTVTRAAKHPHNNLKIPLPPCCANPACRICVMSLSPQQLNEMDPDTRQMYTIWRSLVGHGSEEGVTLTGVSECLDAHGVPLPWDEVDEVFSRYDADGSGHLDFDEFMGLLDDLRVGDRIVKKRVTAYHLPPELAENYSDEELAHLAFSFGVFDKSGDGVMDMKELEAAMVAMGHSLEEHELKFMLSLIDTDRSFTVDFGEFAQLMRRMVDGRLQVDASLMHATFTGTMGIERIKAEVDYMHHGGPGGDPVYPEGVSEITLHATKPDPTVQATFLGDALVGTPYESCILHLQVRAGPRYPLDVPRVNFSRRVVHLNFDVAMAGNTQLPQLMATWDASCTLEWLFSRIYALLQEPDLGLVPAEKTPDVALDGARVADDDVGSEPPGFDLRTKRNTDRFQAELCRLFTDRPDVYFSVARSNAKRYLEIDPNRPPSRLATPDATSNAPLRRARGVGTIVASHLKSTAKHMLFDGLKDFEQFADGDEADEYGGDETTW